MKRLIILCLLCTLFFTKANSVQAQCSICTKTASQLGEKAGKGLNTGIIYLMLTPFAVGGFIGLRWWKQEQAIRKANNEQ